MKFLYRSLPIGADANRKRNPSENAFTIIADNLAGACNIDLKVEEISGRPVFTGNSKVPGGSSSYQFVWDATQVSSGLYIYQLKINGKLYSGKMVKI